MTSYSHILWCMWPCLFIQKKNLCSTQLLIKKANNYWGFDKWFRYRKSEFLHYSHGEGNGTPLQYSCLENPWTEEPGRLQSMGSLRVGNDWATSLSLFTFMHWRRKWQPTPVFWPGESQGRGAWWAAVSGVAQSRTRLKRLSSSSSTLLPWDKCNYHPFYRWGDYDQLVNG